MPPPIDHRTRWLTRVAVLTSLGLVLFLFESLIPRPLPWVKPGLANMATMVALYTLGATAAGAVAILRCLLGSLLSGSMLSPAFWLSLAGSAAAVTVMIIMRCYAGAWFSVVGVGLAGAFAHMVAQVAVAALWIVGDSRILVLVPTMLLSAVMTGLVVGYATYLILLRLAPETVLEAPAAGRTRVPEQAQPD